MMFWVDLGIMACANFVYSIFGSGDVQSWNYEGEEEELYEASGSAPSTSRYNQVLPQHQPRNKV